MATRNTSNADCVRAARAPLGRFAAFVTVGIVGFIVDASVLSALVHIWGWPHYTARALSFAAAVTLTWFGNRHWVFSPTSHRGREYGAYFCVQVVGAVINLGTYALVIALAPVLARLPVVPLAIGAAFASWFNYSAASRWVYAVTSTERRSRE